MGLLRTTIKTHAPVKSRGILITMRFATIMLTITDGGATVQNPPMITVTAQMPDYGMSTETLKFEGCASLEGFADKIVAHIVNTGVPQAVRNETNAGLSDRPQFWLLFSVSRDEYNPPENNLLAFWTHKPSINQLAEAMESHPDSKEVQDVHRLSFGRDCATKYRLEIRNEGTIKNV